MLGQVQEGAQLVAHLPCKAGGAHHTREVLLLRISEYRAIAYEEKNVAAEEHQYLEPNKLCRLLLQ